MDLFNKLDQLLSSRQKLVIAGLLGLTVIFAAIETVGISLVMVFISLATNPPIIFENATYNKIYNILSFTSPHVFVVSTGFFLIVFYMVRAIYTVGYTYALNRFTWNSYYHLTNRLFRNYLSLSYREFTNKNSSQLEKTIITEATYLSQLIIAVMRFISETAVALLLYALLLYSNPRITVAITLVMAVVAILLVWPIRRIITRQGVLRENYQARMYSIINDAFGNFKFIKMLSNQESILKNFSKASIGFSKSNVVNTTATQLPSSVLETIALVLLIGVILYILQSNPDGSRVIPVVSMYALAMFRMVPAANRMLHYTGNILYYRRSLDIVHENMIQTTVEEGKSPLEFNKQFALQDISFAYPGRGDVLKNVNLVINKNQKVAIVGPSGSGKSTLVDILIGIHPPDKGTMLVDGVEITQENVRALRRKIGYIPQNIYLFDGTVAENVAFGQEYDENRIQQALLQARIHEFLTQHQGIHTHVGEGGIKLSGGQKQRIGIARALYTQPEILVLDEATSALDQQTEEQIIDEIYEMSLDRTLIVISHRLSITKRCHAIYSIEDGILDIAPMTGSHKESYSRT
jgi:ABC-type multidrug transport system fused ATPase/permease subunit